MVNLSVELGLLVERLHSSTPGTNLGVFSLFGVVLHAARHLLITHVSEAVHVGDLVLFRGRVST